ncbi:MAG: FmdB family zinc ribbon protein [Terracidiphilus sp.]
MPLYEYRCTKCGHRFEKIQSFSSAPETECPKCHGALERPLTVPALQFKGAGWYVNDYAGKSSGGASGGESAKPAPEGAGDVKPAATESSSASTPASATGSASKSSTPSTSTK